MPDRSRLAPLAIAALLAAPTTAQTPPLPPPPAPPEIVFEELRVVAEGLDPGAAVVGFALTRTSDGYFVTRQRHAVVATDDDADGRVELAAFEAGAPRQGIWAVVDLATGALALAAPEGYPLREVAFPVRAILPGLDGRLDRLRDLRGSAELLLVRPGVGAWTLTAHDGGPGDGDGLQDEALTLALADLVPLDASPAPPEELAPNDVVVVIDPHRLEIFAAKLVG